MCYHFSPTDVFLSVRFINLIHRRLCDKDTLAKTEGSRSLVWPGGGGLWNGRFQSRAFTFLFVPSTGVCFLFRISAGEFGSIKRSTLFCPFGGGESKAFKSGTGSGGADTGFEGGNGFNEQPKKGSIRFCTLESPPLNFLKPAPRRPRCLGGMALADSTDFRPVSQLIQAATSCDLKICRILSWYLKVKLIVCEDLAKTEV